MSPVEHALKIEDAKVTDLRLYHRNPRHGETSVIAESLTENGQYRPVVVNRGTLTGRPNEVLAGNHTVIAARDLGWPTVAATYLDVSDEQAQRIVLADNRTAQLGTFDTDLLAELLGELDDLVGTGFAENDLLRMQGAQVGERPEPDEFAAIDADKDAQFQCPKCSYEWNGTAR